MPQIRRTEGFIDWLKRLRDRLGATKIAIRIERLAEGNPGDVKPVGDGVSEMRINFGPGYRVYYASRGSDLIVLLAGGDKSSQDKDIKTALILWEQWKEENDAKG